MAASQDLDGDSQMGDLSASSSDDAMFPSSNNPDTDMSASKNPQALSSPPSSQQKQTFQVDEPVDQLEEANGSKEGFGKSPEDRFVPGATWNNKKAKEEYARAWTVVEDRDFSLRQFGDPFDETLPENRGVKA